MDLIKIYNGYNNKWQSLKKKPDKAGGFKGNNSLKNIFCQTNYWLLVTGQKRLNADIAH